MTPPLLLLERFQKADEIADLPGVQPELRHARMAGHDTFAKRFFERLDRIPLVKRSEGRRNANGTHRVDGMTTRTVCLRIRLASQDVGRAWNSRNRRAERDDKPGIIRA